MRINLTKKDLVNLIYMQIGFSQQISENLIEDFFQTIIQNLSTEKSLKLSKFGTFSIRQKKSRIGRNPKTKKEAMISERNVVLFKPSKEFKDFVNLKKFKKRLDPRLYNGAIFIGLDSPVVKSHGGTDYIGFSNSLDVCCKIVSGNLIDKIKKNI